MKSVPRVKNISDGPLSYMHYSIGVKSNDLRILNEYVTVDNTNCEVTSFIKIFVITALKQHFKADLYVQCNVVLHFFSIKVHWGSKIKVKPKNQLHYL